MSPEQENFEQLRRLLVLKRHEQPPPGYFDRFPRQVISRIEAGERISDAAETMIWDLPWFRQIWAALDRKPAVAGAFGVAVCALLIGGLVYSTAPDKLSSIEAPSSPVVLANVPTDNSQPESSVLAHFSSTKGGMVVDETGGSLFRQIQKPIQTQPASLIHNVGAWGIPGGN